ncbi:MAG: ATP-binding protein, partial [Promethearchaeota archaeon]
NIITRDIMSRYNIRNFRLFQDLARYLITNFANLFTYSKLRKILSIGDIHTVQRYTSYLEQSFIIFIIEKFSYKLKTQILSPKKVYVIDMGFVEMMGLRIGKVRGRMIENVVAIELNRRLISRKYFDGLYYWKDGSQYEIDFVLFQQKRVIELIQVSYVHTKEDILPRELKNFEKASKDLRCETFTLITWDFEDELTQNGKIINCIPLWKWLLPLGKN